MKAEHVNPFIISVCKVMKDMCMLDLKIGKPSLRQQSFPEENSLIRLGLVGQLSGEVLLNFEPQTALGVVSKMMMMPVNAIDAIGQSAISELGNMVAGNAATVFANNNIIIDSTKYVIGIFITPPDYFVGACFDGAATVMFTIPFSTEIGDMTIDVRIEQEG